MKRFIFPFFISFFFSTSINAQKELWAVNSGDENLVPATYFGNITKYDINGENPVIMHEFDSIHGFIPVGKLFLASNGKLYGTTIKGGETGLLVANANVGVLYEYDLILNQYNVIHYFGSNPIGYSIPDIGVIEPVPGELYGATNNRIYKYDMATQNVTFSNPLGFNNSIHGGLIRASNGDLYGTSYYGNCSGAVPDQPLLGNIIKYNIAANNLSFIYSIYCNPVPVGATPTTPLIEVSPGKLYGTCRNGGANMFTNPSSRGGTIFEFDINANILTKKIDCDYETTGVNPLNLTDGGNGKIYGLCEEGGAPQTCNNPTYNFGTLYEYTPATNMIEVKQNFSFCGNSVRYPTSLMKTSNGYFMGTIPAGGLFRYDADTNVITMPNYTSSNPNLYNAANLIEICRKPSYHFFDVDTFDGCAGGNFNYDVQNTNAASYQWIKDGTDIPGQTTGILNLTGLTSTDAGNYTCLMTNECGTTTTMELHLTVNCLGITTVAKLDKSIKLYPNPTTNWLNIELPKNIDITVSSCNITNLVGQTVYHAATADKIDVGQFLKGIYIVSLQTNYGKWNGKFIKQ